ncbi:hypothetical protein BGW42_003258 [Actinomortierella wolfii]|nr:hypothetical protein BGW42_003258 [Actinomortierella wolfii]
MSNPSLLAGASSGSMSLPPLLPANESQGGNNDNVISNKGRASNPISTTTNTTTNAMDARTTTFTFVADMCHETSMQHSQQGGQKRKRGRPPKADQQRQQSQQLQEEEQEQQMSHLNRGAEAQRVGRGRPRKKKASTIMPVVSRERALMSYETKIPSLQERLVDPHLAELVKAQAKKLLDDFNHSKLNKAGRTISQYWYEIPRWQEFCELNFHNFCLSSYAAVESKDHKWNTTDTPVDKLPGDEFQEYLQRERAELSRDISMMSP